MLSAEDIVKYRSKSAPPFPSIGFKHFDPETAGDQSLEIKCVLQTTKELISFERVRIIGSLSQAFWDPALQLAVVTRHTGSHWAVMGHMVDKKLCLYPEEALYLLEIAALELTHEDVPLSIQRAYSLLLKPQTDVSVDKYRVYSQLNGHGYRVLRHCTKNILTHYEKGIDLHKANLKHKDLVDSSSKKRKLSDSDSKTMKRPVEETISNIRILPVNFKKDDNMSDVLQKLQIFKSGCESGSLTPEMDYDVYLPSSFKKNVLRLPKFRLRIFRSSDASPSVNEMTDLSKQFEDDVPIIYAIVFPDFISYYSISPVDLPLGVKLNTFKSVEKVSTD